MKKKIIIIVGIVVLVAAVAIGYFNGKKTESIPVVMQTDQVTGQSTYTNTQFGFSVAYSFGDWEGPAERIASKREGVASSTNAIFLSPSTSEAVVIQGKAGDTQTLNDLAASLEGSSYQVVTVGGQPALRYEYTTPVNEEATAYARTVIFAIQGLKSGSVTIAYQKIAPKEAELKKATLNKFNDFVSHVVFQ